MISMSEQIDALRDRLYELLEKDDILSQGEALKLSQELDMLIYYFYNDTMSAQACLFFGI
jgi:hypothetical protein